MTIPRAEAVSTAVTDAVLAVPGVACLRPGLRSLLHAAVRRPGVGAGATGRERSAVRLTFSASGSVAAVHIEIVARAQHRTADAAAAKVTVTGIV
ncbi:hypothetical protein ACFWP3_23535 [Streptomyces sp. NPDC058525]|uniref:hypothetical protein n=1 Tax=Streptomyces sp. NPDC058525 TaxID=3346538 RepID=UPI00365A49E1